MQINTLLLMIESYGLIMPQPPLALCNQLESAYLALHKDVLSDYDIAEGIAQVYSTVHDADAEEVLMHFSAVLHDVKQK